MGAPKPAMSSPEVSVSTPTHDGLEEKQQDGRPASDYELYIFDMDGVLYRMDDPIPGAAETIRYLCRNGSHVAFLTNNSSQTRADYVHKLARFQIEADESQIMTSAYATGELFKQWGAVGRSVYIIGEVGLRAELERAGMTALDEDSRFPDYVVVGWDRDFHYRKLAWAHQCIQHGAQFIATNRDATYPDTGGRTLPGGGTMVAALQTCSGVEPQVVGKPSPYCFEILLRQYRVQPARCLVVGDRVDTDVAGAHRSGCQAALVLTGVTRAEELAGMEVDLCPDYVLPSINALRANAANGQTPPGF